MDTNSAHPLLDAGVLHVLTAAAEAGASCPTNADMAKELGVSGGRVSRALDRLLQSGHISIQTTPRRTRRITLCGTGARTGESLPKKGGKESWPEVHGAGYFDSCMRALGACYEDDPRAHPPRTPAMLWPTGTTPSMAKDDVQSRQRKSLPCTAPRHGGALNTLNKENTDG